MCYSPYIILLDGIHVRVHIVLSLHTDTRPESKQFPGLVCDCHLLRTLLNDAFTSMTRYHLLKEVLRIKELLDISHISLYK